MRTLTVKKKNMYKKHFIFWILFFGFLTLGACSYLDQRESLPLIHEVELERGNLCTDCHETSVGETIAYERYNHVEFFVDNHRLQAARNSGICALCHRQSFCNDCHVTRAELKPSIKNQTKNYARTIHRGDYFTRHQMDGRINPISCFRCHGNPKSSRTCIRCHG